MRFASFSSPSRKAKRFLVDDRGQDKLRFLSLRFLSIGRLFTNRKDLENFPLIARTVVTLKHCQLNSNQGGLAARSGTEFT